MVGDSAAGGELVLRAMGCTTGETDMRDIIFVAVTIAFFLASIAYVKFCDRIR
jgi:hypothetical protein